MLHSVDATVLFVRDLATCLTFYRDTLGLPVTESTPERASFHMDNVYFLLLNAPKEIMRHSPSAPRR